ncbi:unnamed protein product [Arctia plantaginis]|uniref:Transposable element P transposase-like RNase H domain-containing protein n=1 Tax=Arctia plantaginis TaxID=874455 RepID=A0A8S0ZEZ5_ARCPL|nr:unnamed protein product [Arctia plantaginis]CAB3252419.1 unnamed protein product [Arctia plantaginis]
MGESIVGLPSTHDSDFIFDNNTPQLNGEAAQPSVALSNIEKEMSMVSYTDGHNDGVIHDVAHIVPIHDVQENEETRETVKFDTSTPHTMLRKPLSKPLESSYRKRKLNFTPLETRKKIITVAHEKELYLKKKGASVAIEGDHLAEAKEALVFLITALNGNFKIPVPFFLVDGVTGAQRAEILHLPMRQELELSH